MISLPAESPTAQGPDYAGTQLERQTTYFWMRVGRPPCSL